MEVIGKPMNPQLTQTTSYVNQNRKLEESQSSKAVSDEQSQAQVSLSKDKAKSMVEGLNDFLKPLDKGFRFEFHDKLERYYVTVVNKKTQEVIKEIPPKELLDGYAKMLEFMGLLIDEKV